ncbi:hypothetical protein BV20DRAFT_834173 [Pilatotrama ljubarskyi]|nr:hypothetical protein BV20DRAFT_834173 [Pilatotrama ljubarskyi]
MALTVAPGRHLLVVAQQDLQGHHRRTEHWALAVLAPPSHAADILQLAGNMDTFHFESFHVPDILKITELCGGCPVGDIAAEGGVKRLRELLKGQRVVHQDRMWDCQDWVLEAIRALKEQSADWIAIDSGFTERGLRAKLRDEKEIWERADNHYFERLLAESA